MVAEIVLEAGVNTLSIAIPDTGAATPQGPNLDQIVLDLIESASGNLPPEAPVLDVSAVAENAPGAVVGTLSAVDPDASGPVSFATEDARFEVVGDALKLRDGVSLDFEAEPSVDVVVEAIDALGARTSATLTVAVTDVAEAPTLAPGASLGDLTLAPGLGASVDLSGLGAADQDAGQTPVYVVTGAGGAPAPAGVVVSGDQLVVPGDLPLGDYALEVFATDGALNSDPVGFTLTVGVSIALQAEDAVLIDVGNPGAVGSGAIEAISPTDPNWQGLYFDGAVGDGYVDYGTHAGDAAVFTVDAPVAGRYAITLRYANGDPNQLDRPLDVVVNGGDPLRVSMPYTALPNGASPWSNWTEVVAEIVLETGVNTLSIAIPDTGAATPQGPNLDQIVLDLIEWDPNADQPGLRPTIVVNFQDAAAPVVAGTLAANFDGFGDRGNGFSYGFVTEASATDADGTVATPIDPTLYPADAIDERSGVGDVEPDLGRDFDSFDPRLTGYVALDRAGYPARTAFEFALENGWYEVTVSVGDAGGPNDSLNVLQVEGVVAASFAPTGVFKSDLATVVVEVTDGFLTLAAPDGQVTELQYLEIRELPDLTPNDGAPAPQDYARIITPTAISGAGADLSEIPLDPSAGAVVGIDPVADIVLGIEVAPGRGGVLLESLSDGSIRLYETLTGVEVAFTANTTAGFDSITISPTEPLSEFTSYTLVVDGLRDRGANGETGGATREFQKFTATFATGEAAPLAPDAIAFAESEVAADALLTSVELSPDGQYLFAATLTGEIKRWTIDSLTGALSDPQTLALAHFQNPDGAPRGIVGLAFDPTDPSVLWVTDNDPIPLNGRDNAVPDFSGRVSRITLDAGPDLGGTAETYVAGLPRSNGDHVTNSLEFRVNPDPGVDGPSHLLYLAQGSNTAMGAADSAWGFRPERLLSAAVLEIDPSRTPPAGGFDVTTEPLPADGFNRRFGYEDVVNGALVPTDDGDLKNGGIAIDSGVYAGAFLHFDANGAATVREGADAGSALVAAFYDPFAPDAVVKLFAEGVRNGYDLVWHSNGKLYVPTNGSAAGGAVPDDPATPEDESRTGVEKQDDYLFIVEEGGYSGHPNPLRDNFILNGGNPTAGEDPNEVLAYDAGTAPDPAYDPAKAYSLGANRSPNGVIEYRGNAFGGALQGAIIFTEYSSGDDLRALLLDENGAVVDDFALRDATGKVITAVDPLDLIEDAFGRLYLVTLDRATGQSKIILLDPLGENDAEIVLDSRDAAFFDDRLHFSHLDIVTDPEFRDVPDRNNKDTGVVRISNTGTDPLKFYDVDLTGPFSLADPTVFDTPLAPGAFVDVTINFDRALYQSPFDLDPALAASDFFTKRSASDAVSTIFEGALTLRTSAASETTVDLAGFWQWRPENGLEPNLNELFDIFGFGNHIEGLSLRGAGQLSVLSNFGVYEAGDETEVLSPYWRIADGYSEATFTAMAAYHGPTAAGNNSLHAPGSKGTSLFLFTHDREDSHTVLPKRHPADVDFAQVAVTNGAIPNSWTGDDVFGIKIENVSTDPRLNGGVGVLVDTDGVAYDEIGGGLARQRTASGNPNPNGAIVPISSLDLAQQGHFLRIFQAVDATGAIIPNVFIAAQDYVGINFDYNDNLTIIEGIEPIGFGALLEIGGLNPAAPDDRLVFSSIDTPNTAPGTLALGGQMFSNETVVTLSNDGFLATNIGAITLGGANPEAFEIVNAPSVIAAGSTVEMTVRFIGEDPAADGVATAYSATLTIESDGFGAESNVIALSGIAQDLSESGEEPTLQQIVDAFGYATDVGQAQLANGRIVEAVGDEVLMPYLRALDPTAPVEVIQLAVFFQQNTIGRLGFHGVATGETIELLAQDDQQGQTLLPDGLVAGPGDTGAVAQASFSPTGGFGLRLAIDGRPDRGAWTDPEANEIDPGYGAQVADGAGHQFRFFEAKTSSGATIDGSFIVVGDYIAGSALDFNDAVFLVSNVAPYALSAAEDANADGVNDALRLDADNDGLVDFFDWQVA